MTNCRTRFRAPEEHRDLQICVHQVSQKRRNLVVEELDQCYSNWNHKATGILLRKQFRDHERTLPALLGNLC
jgi:predicted acetyltransferase